MSIPKTIKYLFLTIGVLAIVFGGVALIQPVKSALLTVKVVWDLPASDLVDIDGFVVLRRRNSEAWKTISAKLPNTYYFFNDETISQAGYYYYKLSIYKKDGTVEDSSAKGINMEQAQENCGISGCVVTLGIAPSTPPAGCTANDWTTGIWGVCSVTCGGGTQSRAVTKVGNCVDDGGKPAVTQVCNTQDCAPPVDGDWTIWSTWSACSVACGGGTQDRTRACTNPAPSNGGADCAGAAAESQACNTQVCPDTTDPLLYTFELREESGAAWKAYPNSVTDNDVDLQVRWSAADNAGGSGLQSIEVWSAAHHSANCNGTVMTGCNWAEIETITTGDLTGQTYDFASISPGVNYVGLHVIDNEDNWITEREGGANHTTILGPIKVDIQLPDTSGPILTSFELSGDGGVTWQAYPEVVSTTGGSINARWQASDNVALKRIEIWRAPYEVDTCDGATKINCSWNQITSLNTGDLTNGTLAAGSISSVYYYGIHVVDTASPENITTETGAGLGPIEARKVGLVAYWKLNDNGTPVLDSADGHNGQNSGAITGFFGVVGGAYGFAGPANQGGLYNGTHVLVPHSQTLNFGSNIDFTIAYWFKPDKTDKNQIIIHKGLDNINYERWYKTGITNTGKLSAAFRTGNAYTSASFTGTAVLNNDWQHAVFTVKRDNANNVSINAYLNGAQDGPTVTSNKLGSLDNPYDLKLGSDETNRFNGTTYNTYYDYAYDGLLDDVRVYNMALAPSFVSQLYDDSLLGACIDNDGDGYGNPSSASCLFAGIDCNDTNANIHPNAAESCDGLDNDCNAVTVDGSGEIAPMNTKQANICAGSTQSCSGGAWTDNYAGIASYESPETSCDAIDNDCNGTVDGGTVCSNITYYCDGDNDTYYDENSTGSCSTFNCLPAGCVTTAGNDCDDSLGTINPGAAESCDGLDNDSNAATVDGSGEIAPMNTKQANICAGSTQTCSGGAWTDNYAGIVNYESSEISCDGADNDCDSTVDGSAVCPTLSFSCDADGDTYINENVSGACSTFQCIPGNCQPATGDDCNDTPGTGENTHPNAWEICGNAIDENCNGDLTDCPPFGTIIVPAADGEDHEFGSTMLVRVYSPSATMTRVDIQSPDENDIYTLYLYDDGNHNDFDAGDGVWGNTWIVNGPGTGVYYMDLAFGNYPVIENARTFNVVSAGGCIPLQINGSSNDKLDVVFIADQY
ncbi:MAG: MopE-related protein, partial [bacterium]|nr:MopE-related protein [bacterium]